MTFKLRQGHYVYRPLRERHTGYDVLALQSAVFACGFGIDVDGRFGPDTTSAVKHYQMGEALATDGIAGILTQRALLLEIGGVAELKHGLPNGHMRGHLESECGFQVGNYTAPYKNLSRDLGPVQDNLPKLPRTGPPTEADCLRAFNVPESIGRLATFIRTRYDAYWKGGNNPHVKTRRRAWELAAGAWNRPAHTDLIAAGRGAELSEEKREWIEGYMARVTTYVVW